jgi:hypothetical protein
MDAKLQSVIEKIQALRALAGSNTSLNEANAAANMANKLLETYRLQESDVASSNPELDPIAEDDRYIYESGKVTPWKASLVRILAAQYGVAYFNDCIRHPDTGRQISRYRLIGRKSDVEIVHYFFAWLVLECNRLSQMFAKGNGRVFIASWCEGFVVGIKEQLELSRASAQEQASSQAIIHLDNRMNESKAAMYAKHTNLKKSKASSYRQRDQFGFDAGKTQGSRIHLGSALGSSGKGAKLLGA